MVRSEDLLKIFPRRRLLVSNRDPYANIASQVKRYANSVYAHMERADLVRHLAKLWIYRSEFLLGIADARKAPVLCYEAFCQAPETLPDALGLPDLDLAAGANIKVKDYERQGISDMNARQISALSEAEIEMISGVLSPRKALLGEFSYQIA